MSDKENKKVFSFSKLQLTLLSIGVFVLINVFYFLGRIDNDDSKAFICSDGMVQQKEYYKSGKYKLNVITNEDGNPISCSNVTLEPEMEYYDYRQNSSN